MDDPENREIEALRQRMLGKQLWVIMSKRVAPLEQVRKHLKAHLEHQIALEKQGIMYGAGPATVPGENEPAFGLIIIRASSSDEARQIAERDPMHAAGVRTYTLYQWSMNEGRLSITLDFSDRSYRLD
ncbi:MAG: YciI family protein [Xanthobacteraceae bacterium]